MGRNLIVDLAYRIYASAALSFLSRYPIGENLLDRKWDTLIILDACRVDALREVQQEYNFLADGQIEKVLSLGSNTSEWMAQTFTADRSEEFEGIAWVGTNAWFERIVINDHLPEDHSDLPLAWTKWNVTDANNFLTYKRGWMYSEDFVPPRKITDAAINVARKYNPDRLIVHYGQPHTPYKAQALAEGRGSGEWEEWEEDPIGYLRNGGDRNRVWEAYLNELRAALDEVALLRNNLDSDCLAISADHGELFGRIVSGHGAALPFPNVRYVPWTTTTAFDTNEYDPEMPTIEDKVSVDEHLRAMGYKI